MNFQHTDDRRMLADTLDRFIAEQYGFEARDSASPSRPKATARTYGASSPNWA